MACSTERLLFVINNAVLLYLDYTACAGNGTAGLDVGVSTTVLPSPVPSTLPLPSPSISMLPMASVSALPQPSHAPPAQNGSQPVVNLISIPYSPFEYISPHFSNPIFTANPSTVNCLTVQITAGQLWPDDLLYWDNKVLPNDLSTSASPYMSLLNTIASFDAGIYTLAVKATRYWNMGLAMGTCQPSMSGRVLVEAGLKGQRRLGSTHGVPEHEDPHGRALTTVSNPGCWNMSKTVRVTAGVWQPPGPNGGFGTCIGPIIAQQTFRWDREGGIPLPPLAPDVPASGRPLLQSYFCNSGANHTAWDFIGIAYGGSYGFPLCTSPIVAPGSEVGVQYVIGLEKPSTGPASPNGSSDLEPVLDQASVVATGATVRFVTGGPFRGVFTPGEDLLGFNPPEDAADVTHLPPSVSWRFDRQAGVMSFSGPADVHGYATALSMVRYANANATQGSVYTGPGKVTEGNRVFHVEVTLANSSNPAISLGTAVLAPDIVMLVIQGSTYNTG